MKKMLLGLLLLAHSLSYGQGITAYKETKAGLSVSLSDGTLLLQPVADNVVRVRYFKQEESALRQWIFKDGLSTPVYRVSDNGQSLMLKAPRVTVLVDKRTGALSFLDAAGKKLLAEVPGARKWVPGTVQGEPCVRVEEQFDAPQSERIFGLGQFQDGNYNLRGVARRLTQVNTQIAIPFIYSSRGYGLLWNQSGLTDFNPADAFVDLQKQDRASNDGQVAEVTTTSGTQRVSQSQSLYRGTLTVPQAGTYSLFLDLGSMGNRHFVEIDGKPVIDQSNMWLPPTVGTLVSLKAGVHKVQLVCKSDNTPRLSWAALSNTTTFRSPHAKEVDYMVFAGSADAVIASYRKLTGAAPMLPRWAYGFWQCRERYASAEQLVETVKQFRQRQLPVDAIVQDWQYWGNNGWGVPKFDEKNYPNPSSFIARLHEQQAHFMVSIWSNPDKNSEMGKTFVANNRFIPGTKWLDYFNPETRTDYWTVLKQNMFDNGVDSWWMDAVEPENDALVGERTYWGPGEFYRLAYPYLVSQSVYEGQRAASNAKRVCILTRSAYLGQQRFGVVNWSGDIGGTWDTYKRQIVAGLNYSMTGFPYWTTDIGGFFRPGASQYTDPKYHELLIRWFQWGVFNPVFRVHGYMSETEPWKYGEKVEGRMRSMLQLRYRLLPYIYSEAWKITASGSTLMRPLVMDYATDTAALNRPYEYSFGKSLLVAPVTEPGVSKWTTYLPKATAWYDFWTDERYAGGKSVTTSADLDRIPLFVKAGSILPVGPQVQSTSEMTNDTLEIRIYAGANGTFALYEDENDGYNYEKGSYTLIPFTWNEGAHTLTVDARKGSYPGMRTQRVFKVSLFDGGSKVSVKKTVRYSGKQILVFLK
jgi:alpha-D-xyloside xylohydrolase